MDAKWTLNPFFSPLPKKEETLKALRLKGFIGAAGRIRTADLILTKDALYLLSYSSIHAAYAALYSKRRAPNW